MLGEVRVGADSKANPLIDYFAIALTHGLLALAIWRLLRRDDLDHEPADTRLLVRKRRQNPR